MFDYDKDEEALSSLNKNSDEPSLKGLESTRKNKKKIFFADEDELIRENFNSQENKEAAEFEGPEEKKEIPKFYTMINNSVPDENKIPDKNDEYEKVVFEGNEDINEKNKCIQNSLLSKIANKLNSRIVVPTSDEPKGKMQQYLINEPASNGQTLMAGKSTIEENFENLF